VTPSRALWQHACRYVCCVGVFNGSFSDAFLVCFWCVRRGPFSYTLQASWPRACRCVSFVGHLAGSVSDTFCGDLKRGLSVTPL
jgi:hypothetical protein